MINRVLLIAIAATAALMAGASPAAAQWPIYTDTVHGVFVLLHVFGAIIFLGNLIVTAMWMANAKKTRDATVLFFASKMVVRADWFFTLPGAVLILVPGLLAVGPSGGIPGASWAELSVGLFALSGIIWVAILVPLQKRMVELTREAMELRIALSDQFYRVQRRWMMWGGIATLPPLIALYLMVFKPHLWG